MSTNVEGMKNVCAKNNGGDAQQCYMYMYMYITNKKLLLTTLSPPRISQD